MRFRLVAASHGKITQDIDVAKDGRHEVCFLDLSKGGERVLGAVQVLNDKLDRTVLLSDDRVTTILVSLDSTDLLIFIQFLNLIGKKGRCADLMSNLA